MNLTSIVRAAAAGGIALAALSAVATPVAFAQEPNSVPTGSVQEVTGATKLITLKIGEGKLFKTPAPYAKLSVTDEKILEVTPQSDREFLFNPRGIGSTNVFVFDDKNLLIARVDVNVVDRLAKVPEFKAETYDEIPGRVRIYGRIYQNQKEGGGGEIFRPTSYHCNATNCEITDVGGTIAGPSPVQNFPDATEKTTSPQAAATPDNEKAQ